MSTTTTLYFFESSKVKIFPCYSRGSFTVTTTVQGEGVTDTSTQTQAVVFDPEARLITETNFTNIYGNILGQRSYIIDIEDNIAKFVINGYYFEISDFTEDLQESFSKNNVKLWIKLDSISLTKGDDVDTPRTTYALASLNSNAAALDIFVEAGSESHYECTAICYSTDFNPSDTDQSFYHFLDWNAGLNMAKSNIFQIIDGKLSLKLDSESKVLSQSDAGLSIDLSNYKTRQEAIEVEATKNNEFIGKITQDAQGVITITPKAVDFGAYRTTTDQDAIDANFVTKQNVAAAVSELNGKIELKADKSVVEAMYTNAQIDGFIDAAKKYADDNDADTKYHVEYDTTGKKIKLVAGEGSMEIDATDFIKDGMIDTVTIGTDNDLVITFNTAAGKENIVLPLDQLADIYTGTDGARVKVTVNSDKSIEADLEAGSISKNYLDTSVQASLALADSALQAHQNISHLATTAALNKAIIDEVTRADASYATTGNVDTAKQEAIDAAKAYANGLDHKNTTYTVAATENALEFTLTSSEGDVQTVALNAPIVSITNLDDELQGKINSLPTSDNIDALANRVTSLESDAITTNNYSEKIPVATASTPGLMSKADKATVDSISENFESLIARIDELEEKASAKLDKSEFDSVAASLAVNVSDSLSKDDNFVSSVADKLDGNTFEVYAIAFDANGGTGTMQPQVSIGNSYKLPECSFSPGKSCYIFKGWGTSADTETALRIDTVYTLTANTIFYALWEASHTEEIDEAVAPTCTETGLTEGKHCSKCGEVFVVQETVAALGHTWNEATTEVPKTCSVCSATEGEPLPPETPDNPGDVTDPEDTNPPEPVE